MGEVLEWSIRLVLKTNTVILAVVGSNPTLTAVSFGKRNMGHNNTYSRLVKIIDTKFLSCYLYHMRPDGVEKKHFHDGIEIEYVLKGNTKTHKQGNCIIAKKVRFTKV